jgi:hypothetical protein
MPRNAQLHNFAPLLLLCAACGEPVVPSSPFRDGGGSGVARQTVVEEQPPEPGEDVAEDPDGLDAPEAPRPPRDDAPATVCNDMGPVSRPVKLAWTDAPSADSIEALDDGVAWVAISNHTETAITARVTIIVGNGSESIEHVASDEGLTLLPGQSTNFAVDLGALRIANPSVRNSENALVRLDFPDPMGSGPGQAFSSTLYFHQDGDEIIAYGQDALRDQFDGGDLQGIVDPTVPEEVPDVPPSVVISEG